MTTRRLLTVIAACELAVVALEATTRLRRPRPPQGWFCPSHSDVAMHPAGGGFCFKCAQARREVSA